MNCTPIDFSDLDDEIWDIALRMFRWDFGLKVDTGMIKTFKDVGIEWIYFANRKNVFFEGAKKADYYGLNCGPSQKIC